MSAMSKDQLDVASKFMTAFWKEIVKPYYNPENTEEWWGHAIDGMDAFSKKYCADDKRLMKILVGFFNGLNEVYKDDYSGRQA